ncbi:phosphohistidine phosphatase SixA [Moraxella sp. ZJ142]|uniref:phosphohistidine phosphatase SixA n=1 Tax=Moraxella marmotae TaxID=3344520 RepID=UPI0035D4F090
MKLIFIRHGQAEPYCDDDAGRNLTEFGQTQAAQTAEYITARHTLDLIIASPYNRADQTAKTLLAHANAAGQEPSFITVSSITPDDDPNTAIADIDYAITSKFGDDTDDKCIAVVCHMPIVAYMVAHLDGLSPASFELAECRVLTTHVLAADLGRCVDRFVPVQP